MLMKILFFAPIFFISFYSHAQNTNNEADYKKGHAAYFKMDYEKAVKFLTKAADAGNTNALYDLGECYEFGRGVEENINKAIEYFIKAIEGNNVDAMIRIARLYKFNNEIKNKDLSLKYFLMAADAGDLLGCIEAAELLHQTGGFVSDIIIMKPTDTIAYLLAKRAALGGKEEGMSMLATYLHYGIGIEKNMGGAIAWYREAANKNDDRAKTALQTLTGEQRTYERNDYRYFDQVNKNLEEHPERRLTKADLPGGYITPEQTASYNSWKINSSGNSSSAERKKTCSICGGTGNISSHETFTDGKTDKNNTTQYGQTTKRSCSRCGGKGYITY